MEDRVTTIGGRMRVAAARRNEPGGGGNLEPLTGDEWFQMGMPQMNLLLVGSEETLQPVLQTVLAHVRKPIANWTPGGEFTLPSLARMGTLVLHEVGALELRQQVQLLEWSERAMRAVQVVSTTSSPLFPRVGAGTFIDTLYYRLNTVYMDFTQVKDAA